MEITIEKKPQALLKPTRVAELLGISLRKLWQMAEANEFPRPVHVGKRGIRWREHAVAEYIERLT